MELIGVSRDFVVTYVQLAYVDGQTNMETSYLVQAPWWDHSTDLPDGPELLGT